MYKSLLNKILKPLAFILSKTVTSSVSRTGLPALSLRVLLTPRVPLRPSKSSRNLADIESPADIEGLAEIENLMEIDNLAGERELGCCSASLRILVLGYILGLGFELQPDLWRVTAAVLGLLCIYLV